MVPNFFYLPGAQFAPGNTTFSSVYVVVNQGLDQSGMEICIIVHIFNYYLGLEPAQRKTLTCVSSVAGLVFSFVLFYNIENSPNK